MGVGVPGVKPDHLPKAGQSLPESPALPARGGEVIAGLEGLRVQGQGLAVADDRSLQVPQHLPGDPKRLVQLRQVPAQSDGLDQALFRLGQPPHELQRDRQAEVGLPASRT